MLGPDENIKGVNKWLGGMRMAGVDEKVGVEALIELVEVEEEWIGIEKGTSLYMRGFVIGSEGCLGVGG